MRNLLLIGAACAVLLLGSVPASAQRRSASVVNIEGASYYVHTVKKGETLYSLARLYDVPQDQIIKYNPQAVDGLREEQVLKIPVTDQPKQLSDKQMARRYETHTVQRGETAYSICRNYAISLQTLLEDNPGLDPAVLSLGQQLSIRKSGMGKENEREINREWNEYATNLNSVSSKGVYHVVQPGETVYSLSRKYGVSQSDIAAANKLEAAGLKAGMLLHIPGVTGPLDATAAAEEVVAAAPAEPLRPAGKDRASTVIEELFGAGPGKSEPRKFEGGQMNVALMLPLQGTTTGRNFLEFYQGALLACEDLRRQGVGLELNLYDTENSTEKTAEIVASYPFQATDLVVGPVYEAPLKEVIEFACEKHIPLVSPLAQVETQCPLLYQLAPDPALKYDKLRKVLSPDRNVVVISGAVNDQEFENEITPLLPASARRFAYSKSVPVASLDALMRGDKETVLVVLAQDEYSIDGLLARLSSVRNNLLSRGVQLPPVTVVGSSRWQRFTTVDKSLYFKLNVCLISSYHADRSNPAVQAFNRRYVNAFSSLPSLYSYRGYDALKLFVGTYARRGDQLFETALNLSSQQLLQMSYHFTQRTRTMNHVNTDWALVCYKNDYTIEVK